MPTLDGLRLSVLGATGHVGRAALDVAARAGSEVVALAAHSKVEEMAKLCAVHRPALAALADEPAGRLLADRLQAEGLPTRAVWGAEGLEQAACCDADAVVAAIGGVAGVLPTMAAARAGKRILLANKEALVTAGRHMLAAAAGNGAELIPVDSEHGALLELLHMARERGDEVRRVWLTASGGPFHGQDMNLNEVSPAMAAAHPVWKMGAKISIDSATLMNKGLEVIEASLLFDLEPESIGVVVHPQGLVHAIVDFSDGGSLLQSGAPDMRQAVARAMAWPDAHRIEFPPVDWCAAGALEFHAPDVERFPCLRLAQQALRDGGVAPAVLNAANEVAVEAFCAGNGVGFTDIPPIVERALEEVDGCADSLESMVAADRAARDAALRFVDGLER